MEAQGEAPGLSTTSTVRVYMQPAEHSLPSHTRYQALTHPTDEFWNCAHLIIGTLELQ